MLRRLLLPLSLLAVSLTFAAAGTAATQKSTGLTGEVGPGFTIELKQGTKDVKTLKAGTYTYQCDPHASAGMKGTFKVTR